VLHIAKPENAMRKISAAVVALAGLIATAVIAYNLKRRSLDGLTRRSASLDVDRLRPVKSAFSPDSINIIACIWLYCQSAGGICGKFSAVRQALP
jgi:hypothetical protein